MNSEQDQTFEELNLTFRPLTDGLGIHDRPDATERPLKKRTAFPTAPMETAGRGRIRAASHVTSYDPSSQYRSRAENLLLPEIEDSKQGKSSLSSPDALQSKGGKQVVQKFYPAPLGTRLMAIAIDLLVWPALLIPQLIAQHLIVTRYFQLEVLAFNREYLLSGWSLMFAFGVFWVYLCLIFLGRGKSVGMEIMGIQSLTSKNLLWKSLYRWLLILTSPAFLFLPLLPQISDKWVGDRWVVKHD